MADFTMCSNQECLLRDMCERQTAERSKRQSFAHFFPEAGSERCTVLIPNEKYKAFEILKTEVVKTPAFAAFAPGTFIRFIPEDTPKMFYVRDSGFGLKVGK
ncbi:MAG TPA: hypothetical protein VFM18_18875 [Methanosarcina sp.]|nr:hypothetical protein [Methanosarcina sp.]